MEKARSVGPINQCTKDNFQMETSREKGSIFGQINHLSKAIGLIIK